MSAASGRATAHAGFLRRHGGSLAFWLIALAAAATVATVLLWPAPSWGANDPESQSREGMQALSKVLQHHGVEVTVVRTGAQLAELDPQRPTTLVVTNRSGYMTSESRQRATELGHRYQRVVLLGQSTDVLRGFGVTGVGSTGLSTLTTAAADCTDPAIGQALRVGASKDRSGWTTAYSLPPESPLGLRGCFPVDAGAGRSHLLVHAQGNPEVLAFSDESMFTNEQVLVADNAALALTLLGNNQQLVWFSTGVESDDPGKPASTGLAAVLPPWWDAVQRLVTWTLVLALVWQVRRFGPLVSERMPVVVRAIETTLNRGHLYHRAGARDRAVSSLQRGTRQRLRQALALPRDSPDETVARAVALATGRDPREVQRVLNDAGDVHDDQTMVLRAQTLAQLEEEVRHP
ncbi:DUF4350 domain-containing protein [Aestuariimicrobium sp. T2.26MG-19.2B]|uniref:DUF4350 domain-containing protein n=1 Tax=Aestuariimicrobium sp. T2.26MG-19.2B TaxID=3040679 RepID=UPI0024776B34|nr:DUF4350 domain-containing protein [Aestuariimicrobium sp. T2.26MG-19.2B]CAI9409075.1 putative membrane protein [Aestuariimicrobium sp. T2.26MG-19.2B]